MPASARIGAEAIFGAAGERLHIRHESSESAERYVGGALLALGAFIAKETTKWKEVVRN